MGLQNDQFFDLLPAILALLGLAIVAVVGWVVWVFARSGSRRPSQNELPESAAGVTAEAPVAAQPSVPVPFLALTRGIDGWEIYIRGQRYGSLDAVLDAQTRDEVMDAIRALARFAHDYVQRQRGAGKAVTPPEGDSRTNPPTRDTAPSPRSIPRPPTLSAVDPLQRRISSSPALIPSINLAQEIGEIVDEMLAKTPSLQGHAVSLTSGAGGGIVFAVDGKLYRELDDIPHPEILELIRQATKEWERR
jgi:hypothetical protein